jgi:hypothetical protein
MPGILPGHRIKTPFQTVSYALIGLIFGIFVALAALLGVLGAAAANSGGLAETIGFGIGGGLIGIVVLPIFYGIMGLIVGLISAALYNVVARLVGGIRIETS